MREIKFFEKGSGVLTEAYSAILEGIPGSSEQDSVLNNELLEAILSADRVSFVVIYLRAPAAFYCCMN
jgi:hypothetical protein